MGRKIVSLIFVLIAFISLPSCDPSDIDGVPLQGEWYYVIANKTNHNVNIEIGNRNPSNQPINYFILSQDSIIKTSDIDAVGRHVPFDGYPTYIIFDDTLKYKCPSYITDRESVYASMIYHLANYTLIIDTLDIHLYRYEITEEDYEYAKAHPYKLEEEWVSGCWRKIQVSSVLLPNIPLCLEGSTERSDGNPGRRLGKIAMVARNASWVIGHTMVLCLEGSTLHGF